MVPSDDFKLLKITFNLFDKNRSSNTDIAAQNKYFSRTLRYWDLDDIKIPEWPEESASDQIGIPDHFGYQNNRFFLRWQS